MSTVHRPAPQPHGPASRLDSQGQLGLLSRCFAGGSRGRTDAFDLGQLGNELLVVHGCSRQPPSQQIKAREGGVGGRGCNSMRTSWDAFTQARLLAGSILQGEGREGLAEERA